MMRNKKGIMLYELVISFFILSIISIFMLNTIFTYKDKNERARLVSQMLVFKANITSIIERDLKAHEPYGIISGADVTSFITEIATNTKYTLALSTISNFKLVKNVKKFFSTLHRPWYRAAC